MSPTRAEIIDNTIEEMRRLQARIEYLEAMLENCEKVRDSWCEAYTALRDERQAAVDAAFTIPDEG
jgi:hypothetical protein